VGRWNKIRTAGSCVFFVTLFPAAALADLSGTPTLQALGSLDLDTGKVLTFPSEQTDLGWNSSLHAEPFTSGYLVSGMTGSAAFAGLTQSSLSGFVYRSNFSISPPNLAAGVILAFKTKNGNYSKVLVTAVSPPDGSGSISLQFTTYGVGGSGNSTQPTVTAVENNYSLIPQGLPNWAIAPGTIFIIQGSGLANVTTPLQSSGAPGLTTALNGVSVQVQVVNTKVQCFLYYLSPTQIDAVLPSTTPAGAGTLTVTNNGATSAGTQINIVQSAFGILSYNGTVAAAYDAGNNLISPFNAANPSQTIVLWGSGIGADFSNDDRLFPQKQHNLAGAYLQAFVGGAQAAISYAGRSQYPGLDQIVLTIPANVAPGCYVSVFLVASQIMPSNFTTIPIASSGRACSDAAAPVAPQQYQRIASQQPANVGVLAVVQSLGANPVSVAAATFQRISGYGSTVGNGSVSVGSCIVTNSVTAPNPQLSGLDAGRGISMTGTGASITLVQNLAANLAPGTYAALLGSLPSAGGALTFDNSAGGADVGHFTATLNFPASFTWTNQAQVTGVTRALGVTVTWSGGSGGFAGISGSVSATIGGVPNSSVSFTCYAPVIAGTFTVPPGVLLALPPGSGSLTVGVISNQQPFTASGLDFGSALGSSLYTKTLAYDSVRQ
jgi:uncharacterized protein (TIGR03437 family)